jgi:hypothetical protein
MIGRKNNPKFGLKKERKKNKQPKTIANAMQCTHSMMTV